MVEIEKHLQQTKVFGGVKGDTWSPSDTPFLQEGKTSTYKIPIPFSKLCQGLNSLYWAIPPLVGNAYDKYINLYFFGWWRSVRKPIVRPDPTTGSVLFKSDAVDHLTQLAPLFEPTKLWSPSKDVLCLQWRRHHQTQNKQHCFFKGNPKPTTKLPTTKLFASKTGMVSMIPGLQEWFFFGNILGWLQ